MAEKSQLTKEERFTQLRKAKQLLQIGCPKVQRVAPYLRDRPYFSKIYSPRLVSIGPIHHGYTELQQGEQYKLMWADMYLERTGQTPETLHKKIEYNIFKLMHLFSDDVIKNFKHEDLSWMLFVDGCSLLQILDRANPVNPEEMNVKVDQMVLVLQDVLLLENQLPYQVLKLLSCHENEAELLESMDEFLHRHHLSLVRPGESAEKRDVGKVKNKEDNLQQEHTIIIQQPAPAHLLDHLYRTILQNGTSPEKAQQVDQDDMNENYHMTKYRNIKELKAAGIAVKASKSRRLTDISLSSGLFSAQLNLPQIFVKKTTGITFHNLIAYEMCPDFENDYMICSFVAFLGSLISHPDDVKDLRSAGIVHSALGTDEHVAALFNIIKIDSDPELQPKFGQVYGQMQNLIRNHYQRYKIRIWIIEAFDAHFRSPWKILALLAGTLIIALTFIQTWYAIHPRAN